MKRTPIYQCRRWSGEQVFGDAGMEMGEAQVGG